MPAQVLIDNEYATLWYHPDKKIVHHAFKKWVPSPVFRDVLTKGADAFERYGAQKWLSDDRGNGAIHPDDSEWSFSAWTPRVVDCGWKYWAVVMPEKALGKMNMRQWIKMYSDMGVEVQTFSDPAEALKWLESK